MACGWGFTAGSGQKWVVRFNEFSLDSASDDSVSIYDGSSESANLIERLDGNSLISGDILTSGPDLYIKFTRQCSSTIGDFEIHYFLEGEG